MKQIKAQALSTVDQTLGLAGGGAQQTFFSDGELVQVFNANQAISRGRTLADSEGLWVGQIINTNAGAGVIQTVLDPYTPSPLNVFSGYPSRVPTGYDFWMIAATAFPGAAALTTDAYVRMNYPTTKKGISAAAAGGGVQVLAAWDSDITLGAAVWLAVGTDPRTITQTIGYRVPRTVTISFFSDHIGAGTVEFSFQFGLFPSSLGQDVLV